MQKYNLLLLFLSMPKTIRKDRKQIKSCGGGKKKGSCGNWAGATVIKTNIKVTA